MSIYMYIVDALQILKREITFLGRLLGILFKCIIYWTAYYHNAHCILSSGRPEYLNIPGVSSSDGRLKFNSYSRCYRFFRIQSELLGHSRYVFLQCNERDWAVPIAKTNARVFQILVLGKLKFMRFIWMYIFVH